jgi:hypothetical protein
MLTIQNGMIGADTAPASTGSNQSITAVALESRYVR